MRPVALLLVLALLAGCIASAPAVLLPRSDNTTAATLTVRSPWPSILEFLASAENITTGENITLRWRVADAEVVYIEPGIGRVEASGSRSVAPLATTRYTLNADGQRGTAIGWVEVKVDVHETPRPDLIITGVTHISGLLYYRIRNVGTGVAGPSDTWLYDQSRIHRDTSWVEGLQPGEEKTLPFTNYDWPGTEITICADGDSVLTEVSEENNCYKPTFGSVLNYNLLAYAASASWRGSAGRARYGPDGDSVTGFINRPAVVVAADGRTYTNVLEVIPPAASYGWVEGIFGEYVSGWNTPGYMMPLELPANASFKAQVALSREAVADARAICRLGVIEAGGGINWLAERELTAGAAVQGIEADLSAYAGQKVMLVLRTEAGLDPQGLRVLWLEAGLTQAR